jgi:NADH:ubiquinone oxidoreductase subunit E
MNETNSEPREETMTQTNCCACASAPSEEELGARLDEVLADYRGKPGALIPVLQIAQGLYGYLPETALRRVAAGLGQSYAQVAGVVTFYSYFSTVPRGKHLVRVCLGTACYVRGGKAVLDAFKQRLGIDVGGTTPDRQFSLEVARCFGACGLAPAIMIDDTVHHRVKPAAIGRILAKYADTTAAPKEEKPCDSPTPQL